MCVKFRGRLSIIYLAGGSLTPGLFGEQVLDVFLARNEGVCRDVSATPALWLQ